MKNKKKKINHCNNNIQTAIKMAKMMIRIKMMMNIAMMMAIIKVNIVNQNTIVVVEVNRTLLPL